MAFEDNMLFRRQIYWPVNMSQGSCTNFNSNPFTCYYEQYKIMDLSQKKDKLQASENYLPSTDPISITAYSQLPGACIQLAI